MIFNNSNPFDTIQQIAGGYCLARCLHAIADFGVADVLNGEPKTAEEVASATQTNPGALRRAVRLLSAYGIFEINDNKISHTPASQLLRKDHPQSMRGFTRMFSLPINWKAYEDFNEAIRTGEPNVEKVYTGGFWKYFGDHKQESAIFNEAMADKANVQLYGIMSSYDFSNFKTIGDIGGGRGHLLQAVLHSTSGAQGVLFDLPHVIEDARKMASDRLTLQAGDFFKDSLPACDAYLVMEIIHDWPDAESIDILRAIRKSAPPQAKLLLIESIIPDSPDPDWSKMLDIHMLTLLGGKQRTTKEFEALLTEAGFALTQEIDCQVGISILEASVV
jgi:hypothetical protein